MRLTRIDKGSYEGSYKGRDVKVINAQEHHGHHKPYWLLIIDGNNLEGFDTKREALLIGRHQIDTDEKNGGAA